MDTLFPNLVRSINSQIPKAQQIPSKRNKKSTTPSHIIIQVLKTSEKPKRRSLK